MLLCLPCLHIPDYISGVLMICFELRKYTNIPWYVHLQNYDTFQLAVILPL